MSKGSRFMRNKNIYTRDRGILLCQCAYVSSYFLSFLLRSIVKYLLRDPSKNMRRVSPMSAMIRVGPRPRVAKKWKE